MRARLLCPERRVHFCSVAVCGSVLKCVAVCCNVLQCVIVCCSVLQCESRHTRESCHTQTPQTWVMSHTNESRHTRESCRMSSGMRNRLYEDTTHMRRLFNRYHKTCRLVQPVESSPHMRSLYMQQSAHMGSLLMQQSPHTRKQWLTMEPHTARSVEDETRYHRRNADSNPEWWGDFSQPQSQNRNSNLCWEIQRKSNSIKISVWICTARYRSIWVFRFRLVNSNLHTIQDFDLHFDDHSESRLPRNALYEETIELSAHMRRHVICLIWDHHMPHMGPSYASYGNSLPIDHRIVCPYEETRHMPHMGPSYASYGTIICLIWE